MIDAAVLEVASSSWPTSFVRGTPGWAPGSALAWMTSGRRSRNVRIPGVSAAARRSNALFTSAWNGVAARPSTSVRLK